MKVEGTDDIYDLTPAPGTVTEEGTFLNVENLLKDTTAALLGGDANMVPDEALVALKTLFDSANQNASARAKIVSGSYVGTESGNSETSFTKTFTFGFKPKLFILCNTYFKIGSGTGDYTQGLVIWVEGVTDVTAADRDLNYQRDLTFAQLDTGLKMDGATYQYPHFNSTQNTYRWIAVG